MYGTMTVTLACAPRGTQVFLSLAFLQETLLMALHQKHAPMDRLVHQLLASTCMACVAFPALEAAWPHSPLLTAGRVAATLLHGAWFLAAARIMFEPGVGIRWHRGSGERRIRDLHRAGAG